MLQPTDMAELADLLGAIRDGTITDEQMRRLDERLAADPEARKFYLKYIDLCTTLRHYHGRLDRHAEPESRRRLSETGKPLPIAALRRLHWRRWLGVAAAAALIASGLGLWRFFSAGRGPLPTEARQDELKGNGGVAILTRAMDARWQEPSLAPGIGTALPTGRLQLNSGLVQLEFYSGATVILEGPADVDLLATDRIFCRRGKLRARVEPSAHGFSIATPKVRLVDLGTEFGLSVQETGEADVHVFDGKVELYDAEANATHGPKRELTKGSGIHFDRGGAAELTQASRVAFVGVAELEERAAKVAQRRFRAWSEASRDVRNNQHVRLYYSFEGQRPWDRMLRNQATPPDPALDGAIVGCQWIDGRWPGKGALDFKRPSDRVRFNLPGAFDALTFMAWVRVDALEQRFNALLLTDGFEAGAPHWQITQAGKLRLGVGHSPPVHPGEHNDYHNYDSDVVFTPDQLGQWKHLATVYDRANGYVVHYVNGQFMGRRRLKAKPTLAIGHAELGNWGVPLSGDHNPVRNLNGRMDEFALFDVALTAAEIKALYENGAPSE